jgi:hypothetical protein
MAKLIAWFTAGTLAGAAAMMISMAARHADGAQRVAGPGAATLSARPTTEGGTEAPEPARAQYDGGRESNATAIDVGAVLADLRAVADPFALRKAALAAVELLGATPDAIERVAAVLSDSDRLSFRIDALAALAKRSPLRALELALELGNSEARLAAVTRIAAEWGGADPVVALAWADTLEDRRLRTAFNSSVLAAWAELDPSATLAWLAAGGGTRTIAVSAGEALSRIAVRVPAELLDAVERLPAAIRSSVRQQALRALGERDPSAAAALAQSMPDGPDRQALLIAAAPGFARANPDAALAWVRNLVPPSRMTAGRVLATIAQTDFDRMLEIVLETPEIAAYPTVLALPIGAHPERIPLLADRLAAAGPLHEASLRTLLVTWGRADSEAALAWALVNRSGVDGAAVGNHGTTMAQQDASAAAAVVARLPRDLHDVWIAGIATSYGIQNPDGATRLVLSLPAGAARDEALGAVVGAALNSAYSFDSALLEAFSSAEARDQVIRDSLPRIRSGNASEAARLGAYIGDPELQAAFERRLAFARNERSD